MVTTQRTETRYQDITAITDEQKIKEAMDLARHLAEKPILTAITHIESGKTDWQESILSAFSSYMLVCVHNRALAARVVKTHIEELVLTTGKLANEKLVRTSGVLVPYDFTISYTNYDILLKFVDAQAGVQKQT